MQPEMLTYCKNIVFSSCRILLRRDHSSFGFNKELALVIPILNTVRYFGIGPFIFVGSYHSIDGLPSGRPLTLWLFTFGQFDLVDLLQELWSIIIFI